MGQPRRVEPVRVDCHDNKVGRHALQGCLHATTSPPHVVRVHRLGQDQIGVGVKPRGQHVGVMVEVALHRVAATPTERLLVTLGRTTEACVELRLAAVGDMGDPASQAKPEVRALKAAVVVTAGEVGVLADGQQLRLAPRDLLGRCVRRAGGCGARAAHA